MNIIGMITVFTIVSVTLLLLLSILRFVKAHEKEHKQQLEKISDLANRDPLTGVKSQRSYIESERRILAAVQADESYRYGLIVCDVNDLKYANDKYGHAYGDDYLRRACQMICQVYKHSPVYRVGGDEFVVIIEGEDYVNRTDLFTQIVERSMKNAATEDGAVVAVGMAIRRGSEGFQDVFHRADERMYILKARLKEKRPSHNLR